MRNQSQTMVKMLSPIYKQSSDTLRLTPVKTQWQTGQPLTTVWKARSLFQIG